MSLLRRHAHRREHWPWRRLWLPREVAPSLDPAGFLYNEAWHSLVGIPKPVHLDALANVPCVVALGDPGLGKSHAVQDYAAAIAQSVPADRLVALDLGDYGSRDELLSNVFRAPIVEAWSGSGDPVHLVLDSLDESQIPIETICGIVLDELGRILERIPRERLRFVLACRTAVMPPYFVHSLKTLFARAGESQTTSNEAPTAAGTAVEGVSGDAKAEGCVVVEIVVLRREDARAAAVAALGGEVTAAAFLDAVIDANAGHFAARPITLRALLARHRAGLSLRGSQADLYRDLCRELSGSISARPRTLAAHRSPHTTLDQRYRVAGRLAAATLFGNRRGIWCGDGPPPSAELLDPRDCDGSERIGGVVVRVDTATSISETLNTALFTGITGDPAIEGTGGVVASHLTFAEFLAADWVRTCEMELPQVLSLLRDPTDPEQRVVPQLRQVAAWLASMRTDVFESVAFREPELLLASDVVDVPESSRGALAASLLERAGKNRLVRPSFGERLAYDRLNHQGLGAQLTPVIEDVHLPARVRHLALEIARACRAETLTSLSAEVALDERQSLDLRAAAAVFVAESGAEPERLLLMTLAAEPTAGDDTEALRGAALSASWKLFTPDELFAILTHPRRSNWTGAYSIALREIASGLDGEYLPSAARWLARRSPSSSSVEFDKLMEAVLCRSLEHAEDNRIRAPLLTYIRRRLRHHLRLGDTLAGKPSERVKQTLENATDARRRLVTALFDGEYLSPPSDVDLTTSVTWIGMEMPELFSGVDVPWALEALFGLPAGDARRATWGEAIRVVFNPRDETHLDAALRYRDDAEVAHATRDWSTHETLDKAREALALAQRSEQEAEIARAAKIDATEEEPRGPGPLGERVTHLLSTFVMPDASDGEVASTSDSAPRWSLWARIFFELVLEAESGRWWGTVPSPETLGELAQSISTDQMRSVVNAALAYLNTESAEVDPYPSKGELRWRTLHGGAAALFVARFAPARLTEVTEAAWRQWLSTLVHYTSYNEETDRTLLGAVFAAAERTSPDTLHAILRDATEASLRYDRRGVSSVARRLAVSTVPVAQALAREAAARAFPPVATKELLSELLREGGVVAEAARTAAARLVADTPAPPQRETSRIDDAATTDSAEQGSGADDDAGRIAVANLERTAGVAAAAALIIGDEDAGWAIIGSRLHEDRAFAREVLLFAAQREHLLMSGATDRLSAGRLSDLYLIVQREFPPENDVWHVGVYSPGPHDVIQQWRSALLTVLENRATVDAVDALARIAAWSPERDWLVQTWLRATAALISARWTGTPVRTLMEMAIQPHLRQVQSGGQLLDILEESLDRLQRDLQGELRSVVGLWDQQRPRGTRYTSARANGQATKRLPATWRPKDEGHLANEVARHLRRDLAERGVIVGRELVVQVGTPGGAPGLRTDLEIRARPAGESVGTIPDIRVIIEVKGSWNREVLTAMKAQLVEDYLDAHHVRHGIYLVGAYTCDAWENSAEKSQSARLGTRAELTHDLREQARALSNPLRDVRAVVLNVALPAAQPRSGRRGRRN